jgi:hypothetical protein
MAESVAKAKEAKIKEQEKLEADQAAKDKKDEARIEAIVEKIENRKKKAMVEDFEKKEAEENAHKAAEQARLQDQLEHEKKMNEEQTKKVEELSSKVASLEQ